MIRLTPTTMVTISQVLPKLNRVKEYEKYYSCLCPMHDDSKPSFLLYKTGWWRCLGCGRSGDLYSLHRFLTGWTSRSATIRSEVAEFHVPRLKNVGEDFIIDCHETLLNFSQSLAWYLRMRGLEEQIIPQKIGWYNGWYTFPVYGYDSDYRGFIMRSGRHIQEATGLRYVIKATGGLYVPDWYLARKSDYIVVTFGILDAITLSKLRIPACSSVHGKTINPDELDWARKPIVFLPDRDEEDAARNIYRQLGWRGRIAKIDYGENCKDPNDLLMAGRGTEMTNAIREVL